MPDTNPLLDEINGLSPGAKSALMQAHQQTQPPNPAIAAAKAPISAPPSPVGMQAPSQMQAPPSLGAAPQPHVSLAPQPKGTLLGDQQALQQEAGHKAPLESVYHGITNSSFGQNHPVLGKLLGTLGQIPATAADVVASGVAPRLGALIPGTSINHGLQLQGLQNRIGKEEQGQQQEATTAATRAEVPLREAQTQEAQARTANVPEELDRQNKLADAQIANLLHPQAKTDFEAWRQQNPDAPVQDWLKAQGQAKAEGQKPPSTKEALQSQLVTAQNSGDTATAKKLQQQLKDIDPMGEQRTQIQIQNASANQSKATDAKTQKEYEYTRNKWDKDLGTYNAQNNKLAEANQLIGSGAMGAALGSIKALSGLAGGQGSGVRITQAELNSIAHARGFQGNFDAFLQQFGDGNKLTPQQVDALKGIITDVQHIAQAKEKVLNHGLDDLGEATDTKTVRKIDSQLRHALMGGTD